MIRHVLVGALTLAACQVEGESGLLPPPPLPAGEHPTVDIFHRPPGMAACPPPNDPSEWSTAVPLFDHTAALPPGLDRFCRYDRISGTSRALGIPPLESHADGIVVAPMSATLGDAVDAGYLNRFMDAAGAAPMAAPPADLPWVVLADTSPTVWPGGGAASVVGRSDHGHAMANIVENLTCVGPCMAELGTSLALELHGPGPTFDDVAGGEYGSITGVARAVARATHAWKTSGTTAGLVIALPVGWLPAYGGEGAPATFDAPAASMWAALVDARCNGAVVVAAAGNETGGPDSRDGGLAPASWSIHRLNPIDCVEALGGVATDYPTMLEVPPLWAVGGVDADGGRTAFDRVLARPPLVAVAHHATVPLLGSAQTRVKTGTSVATAVAAAAAAQVWAHRPSMTPVEVMDTLYVSGTPSDPIDPSMCPGGLPGCGDSAMLDICAAVAEVCATGPCAALGPVSCSTLPPAPLAVDPVAIGSWQSSPDHITVAWSPQPLLTTSACGSRLLYTPGGGLAPDPCPDLVSFLPSAQPRVLPQPHEHLCPHCVLQQTGELYLEVDTAITGGMGWDYYDSVSVTITYSSGKVHGLTTSSPPSRRRLTIQLPATHISSTDPFATAKITARRGSDISEGYLAVAP